MNSNDVQRPDGLTDEHLEFLDWLRESGYTNMFGAAPYLTDNFDINTSTARDYLRYWMATFSERAEEKAQIVISVQRGRSDARAGRVTEHDDFMTELDNIIGTED